MTAALKQTWTQDQFFAWKGHQEGRYEFDGMQPIAMIGSTAGHSIIMRNLHRALDAGLRNTPCQFLGPDAGVLTVGNAVRYPDALVTCSRFSPSVRTIPGVVAVFEIVSPGTSRVDRIDKVREYAAVSTMRRYVIIESTDQGLTVFQRDSGVPTWTGLTLTDDEVLRMPDLGIHIPVSDLYAGMDPGTSA